jgi:hypothetical protein
MTEKGIMMIGTLESPALTRLIQRWEIGDRKEPLSDYIARNADMVRLSDLMADFFQPTHK